MSGSRRGVLVAGRDERADGLAGAAAAFAAPPGGRCWPTRCRGPAAAMPPWPTTTRCCATPASPPPTNRTWCCVSATCRCPSRFAAGSRGSAPRRRWRSTRRAPGRTRARASAARWRWSPPRRSSGLAASSAPSRPASANGWRTGAAPTSCAAEALQGCSTGTRSREPAVAAELGALLAGEATLFVASSMPVRDIESFWPVREDPPRVLCNRGANGIDGTVSRAFGAAAAGDEPVVLLIGDVALAHDIGGLLAARRLGIALTIVLVNNEGGGIFDFLPVAGDPRAGGSTTPTWPRPPGLDFGRAAELYGLHARARADVRGFRAALERALHGAGTRRSSRCAPRARATSACTAGSGRRPRGRSARKQREQGLELDLGLGELPRRVGVADDAVARVAASLARRAAARSAGPRTARRRRWRRSSRRDPRTSRGRAPRAPGSAARPAPAARRRRPAWGASPRPAPARPAASPAGRGSGWRGAGCWRSAPAGARARPPPRSRGRAACARCAGPRSRALRGSSGRAAAARRGGRRRPGRRCGAWSRRARACSTRWPSRRSSSSGLAATSVGVAAADAEREARGELRAQHAEHGRRVIRRGGLDQHLAGEHDLLERPLRGSSATARETACS